jgi:hypothetical protein
MSEAKKSDTRRSTAQVRPPPVGFAVAGSSQRYATIDDLFAAAEPPASPKQRRRFDARKEWARDTLARLKPVDEWRTTATPDQMTMRAKLVETLEQAVIYPSPIEGRLNSDGVYELRW